VGDPVLKQDGVSSAGLFSAADGSKMGSNPSSRNFMIWWDGDEQRGSGGSQVGSGGSQVGSEGSQVGSGGDGTGGEPAIIGQCDFYADASTPCVGAWSTVRRLYSAYTGPLYQVRRTSDDATMDIPQLEDGYADASVQDDFCPGDCTISVLFDQSGVGNDLWASVPTHWLDLGLEADAKALPTTANGHPVYGVFFPEEWISTNTADYAEGTSYRNPSPTGTATGDEAEALYEVVDSTIYNHDCCNSFGNAETTGTPDGPATLEAIYFGSCTYFGSGTGSGPWFLADLEAGTFPSMNIDDPNIPSLNIPRYATLMLKGFSGDRFGLKHGDAQGGPLTTQWNGRRPTEEASGDPVAYTPMHKQGAIVLGSGGDGSPWSTGSFFEGAMTIGCADSDAADDAIQANIVAAGYGQ
jgi:hypothetical protein